MGGAGGAVGKEGLRSIHQNKTFSYIRTRASVTREGRDWRERGERERGREREREIYIYISDNRNGREGSRKRRKICGREGVKKGIRKEYICFKGDKTARERGKGRGRGGGEGEGEREREREREREGEEKDKEREGRLEGLTTAHRMDGGWSR